LPSPHFLSRYKNVGVHIAHAAGVIHALNSLGTSLDIVTGENDAIFTSDRNKVHTLPAKAWSLLARQAWSITLLRYVRNICMGADYDFCYIRYSAGFSPYVPLLRKILKTIPLVIEVNSLGSQTHRWMKLIDRWALSVADMTICISDTLRQIVAERFHPDIDKRIVVIPNGVDVERFKEDRDSGLFASNRESRIGYAGILKSEYGLETLIEAFDRLRAQGRSVSLHFYGDGPHMASLQKQAMPFRGIEFHGAFPFDSIPAVLKDLDILVYSTSDKNSFQSPVKVLEYMASGRPIVAARTPQVNMLLENDRNGLTYRIGDELDLAERIAFALDNPDKMRQMAKRARHRVCAEHTWECRMELLLRELKDRRLVRE